MGVLGESSCWRCLLGWDWVGETLEDERILRVEAVRLEIAGLDSEKGLFLAEFVGKRA